LITQKKTETLETELKVAEGYKSIQKVKSKIEQENKRFASDEERLEIKRSEAVTVRMFGR
jgi:wobble nucleotide-excising tRNase